MEWTSQIRAKSHFKWSGIKNAYQTAEIFYESSPSSFRWLQDFETNRFDLNARGSDCRQFKTKLSSFRSIQNVERLIFLNALI